MLSDVEQNAERQLKQRARGVNAEGRWWSDNQKLEAVQTYLMLGNLAATAAVLKIPEATLRHWCRSTWWKELVGELKVQDELKLSTRLKKIVDKSFDVIEDRLEHGDFVYDQKTGQMRRKPVAMRDAHKVALDLDNKRDLILGRQAPTQSEEQIDAKLNKLAQKFADIVNGKKNVSDDVIDVEAKYEDQMVSDEPLPSEVLSGDEQGRVGQDVQEAESGVAGPNQFDGDNGQLWGPTSSLG